MRAREDYKLALQALQSTHGLAHAVGMGDLHRFLQLGYQAIQPVRDIQRFLQTIEQREKTRLDGSTRSERNHSDRFLHTESRTLHH